MKKLLILALLFAPTFLHAQSTGLINRTDAQMGKLTLIPLSPESAQRSFNIVIQDTVLYFGKQKEVIIAGPIKNLTAGTVEIYFQRTHIRLPEGWITSVCFGGNCWGDTISSTPPGYPFTLGPGDTSLFNLDLWDIMPYTMDDSVIDYLKFTDIRGTSKDTISFILKAVKLAPLAVQDNKTKSALSNPKITSIYPSPLIQGNSIKVKVSSPKESSLSYSIYDGVGRSVALGVMRQHIGLGDNTISIGSLDGLTNGTYMLKFNFGDGSSSTYFFQVLR